MKKVYIETSIVSYLTARPTNDLLAAAWQNTTCVWWDQQRHHYELVTSSLVKEEAKRGNPDAAKRRLNALNNIPNLQMYDEITRLTELLVSDGALPSKATDDAMHVAFAAYHNIDYLLTWNCRHIDNAAKKPLIRETCSKQGFVCPEICTPLELMENNND
ncbi:MAG: DNA-binding protein [Spartobacteria bacterium]|nr:DNA-binding protein [Spartobacteria bacterium]